MALVIALAPLHAQDAQRMARLQQQGEQSFLAKDYPSALYFFLQVLRNQPENASAKQRTESINQALDANPQERARLIEDLIISAEDNYKSKKYAEARLMYQKALALDESAQFPRDRLSDIARVYTDPEDQAMFDDALLAGDRSVKANDFDKAIQQYQIAASVKPDSRVPKDRIAQAKQAQTNYATNSRQVTELIAQADQIYKSGKLAEAKTLYEKALALSPANSYLAAKIKEITAALAAKENQQAQYEKAIADADNYYINRDFANAQTKYQQALYLKPDARYPKEMLQKTATGATQLLTEQQQYESAIASGDAFLGSGDYPACIAAYQKALDLRPAEKYPQSRLTEAKRLLETAKNAEISYTSAIKSGDEAFTAKLFEQAADWFGKALSYKANDEYASGKLKLCRDQLAEAKDLLAKYTRYIQEADQAYERAQYEKAADSYKMASAVKPDEAYPKERLALSLKKSADDKALNESYANVINKADGLFEKKQLNESLAAYREAASLKPTEAYPSQKIAEITSLISREETENNHYKSLLADGEKFFVAKEWEKSLTAYQDALKMKPGEPTVSAKIEEINKIIAEAKQLEATYSNHLSVADAAFANQEWTDAESAYKRALALKPAEKYPVAQLEKIKQALAAKQSLDENYQTAIKEADLQMSKKAYQQAADLYVSALGLKKEEAYPKQKLAEARQFLREAYLADSSYRVAIALADKQMAASAWDDATSAYNQAITIKPNEEYPKAQIAKARLAKESQLKLDQDFTHLISQADGLFEKKEYAAALQSYQSALSLKANEKYPAGQIAEINRIQGKIKDEQALYDQSIGAADGFFKQSEWEKAITQYEKASKIKPDEAYPKQKIEQASAQLAAQRKANEGYLSAIAAADEAFKAGNYEKCLPSYQAALALKPAENYPAEQISKANEAIARAKQIRIDYDKAMQQGQDAMLAKKLTEAFEAFTTATKLLPAEELPKQKLAEISGMMAVQADIQKKYDEAVAMADAFYNQGKLREALEPYQRAVTIKKGEQYPAQMINKINQMLAELQQKEEQFAKALATADEQFKAARFEAALASYRDAQALKPEDSGVAEKISQTEKIISQRKKADDDYNAALAQADQALTTKEYQQAITAYHAALAAKPGDPYAGEQLAKAQELSQQADEQYSKLMGEGDQALAADKFADALGKYQKAQDTKPSEKTPQQKIQQVNQMLALRKEELDKAYASILSKADSLAAASDFYNAKSEYAKASSLKTNEAYPKGKMEEMAQKIREIEESRMADYRKALAEADKLYNTHVYDQAIEAYDAMKKFGINDPYPENQIAKIRKYLDDHAIQELSKQTLTIAGGEETKFKFTEIEPRLRKNNYVLLKARSTGTVTPKVYLNYGRDGQKNGGIVLRALDSKNTTDYLIRLSVQDRWYREDNNWLSLFVESGSIEVAKIQIAAGD